MYPSCQPVVNKYKQIQGQHARFGHCHIVILQGSYGIYRRPPATLCHSNHPQVVTTLKKVGWFQPSQMIYRFVIGLPTFSNSLLLVVCMTQAHDRLHVSDRGLASLAATHFQLLPVAKQNTQLWMVHNIGFTSLYHQNRSCPYNIPIHIPIWQSTT